jgi:hypothetical protein
VLADGLVSNARRANVSELAMVWFPYWRLAYPRGGDCISRDTADDVLKTPMLLQKSCYRVQILVALAPYLLTGVVCSASEAMRYPVAIPDGCFALAQREGYPTIIYSRWEGIKARAKLVRMRNSDPLVRQCKDAVAQVVAEHRATRE